MKHWVWILALAAPIGLTGQPYVEVFRAGYGFSPERPFEQSIEGTRVTHADYELFLPIPVSGKLALITGSSGVMNRLRPDPESPEMGLYSVAFVLGANLEHKNGWTSTHLLLPRLASSFDFGRPGWQFGTLQLLEHKRAPNKSLGFGFYLNTEEYGIMWVPLLTFYYGHPEDKWELRAMLPSRADFNLRLSDHWRAGAVFDGLGSSFPIETPQFGPAYVQRISNDLSLYLERRITPSLLLAVRGGYSVSRAYRIYNADDTVKISIANIFFNDPRTSLNQSVRSGFLFNVRMAYRFKLPAER